MFPKAKIRERSSPHNINNDYAVRQSNTSDQMETSSPRELKKLKDMLTQRDNEISILQVLGVPLLSVECYTH